MHDVTGSASFVAASVLRMELYYCDITDCLNFLASPGLYLHGESSHCQPGMVDSTSDTYLYPIDGAHFTVDREATGDTYATTAADVVCSANLRYFYLATERFLILPTLHVSGPRATWKPPHSPILAEAWLAYPDTRHPYNVQRHACTDYLYRIGRSSYDSTDIRSA